MAIPRSSYASSAPTTRPPMALVEIRDVYKSFQRDAQTVDVFTGAHDRLRGGELHRADGPVGLGQVHAAQPHRGARQADERHRARGGRGGERDDAGAARGVARAAPSASSSSRTTCCRCSPPSRTSSCRCCSRNLARRSAPSASRARAGRRGAGGPDRPLPAAALGRSGAARVASRAPSSPTRR